MKKTNAMIAISSLLSIGAIALSTPAWAADKVETEKCFGVSKAGKNDCAVSAHSCSGQAKMDADAKEFISVPKGTCARLVGGAVVTK